MTVYNRQSLISKPQKMKKVVGIGLLIGIMFVLLAAAYVLFTWRTARPVSLSSLFFGTATPIPTPTLRPTATAVPDTPTPEPTATLEPTATPTIVPMETAVSSTLNELSVITLENKQTFSSYQFNVDVTFLSPDANGVEQEQSGHIIYRFQDEPEAKGLDATIDGMLNLTNAEISLYELDGRTSAVLPSFGCVGGASTVEQLASPFASLFAPDQLLNNLNQAERILPDETINGIPSAHYRIDESLLNPDKVQLDEVSGEFYVALDGNYLVQFVLDGQGSVKLAPGVELENGRLHFTYTLSNIDQPFVFELPAGCAAP